MRSNGFTLIELLVSIGIILVLVAIVLVALNPARQFAQSNNTKRKSDVNALLNAVQQYAVGNKGVVPDAITTSVQTIRKTGGADLCSNLIPAFLAALPVDPLTAGGQPVTDCLSDYDTDYTIVKNAADNRITVAAPAAELGGSITVTQ